MFFYFLFKKIFIKKINIFSVKILNLRELKEKINFSLIVFVSTLIWVTVTLYDKIIISGLVSLSLYGYFTSAVIFANTLLFINTPIGNILIPKLTKLYQQNLIDIRDNLYSEFSQIITVISGSIGVTIIFFHKPLLVIWLGNHAEILNITKVLVLYVIGNILLLIGVVTYYLQLSIGNLKFHLIGHIIILFFWLPGVPFFVNFFGIDGVGYLWLLINLFYFVIWTYVIHSKFMPNYHIKWLCNDILPIIFVQILFSLLMSYLTNFDNEEIYYLVIFKICLIGFFTLIISSLFASHLRTGLLNYIKNKYKN